MYTLFLSENPTNKGGVCEFSRIFSNVAQEKYIYFYFQSSGKDYGIIRKALLLVFDLFRFIYILISNKVQSIFLNPSLKDNSITRDGLYALIASIFNIKIYIHWHGWSVEKEYLLKSYFCQKGLFRANHIRVLSSEFKQKLIDNGFRNSISLGNTMVEESLIRENDKNSNVEDKSYGLLFLATVSRNKGIYETITIYQDLKSKYADLKLGIAGDGPELPNVRKFIDDKNIPDISILGYLKNESKISAFKNSKVYVLPTYYEGMPTSVLEAMYFGIPVVCTLVGGLNDFFESGKMGFGIKNPKDIKSFEKKIDLLLSDEKLYDSISEYNARYARNHFLASKTVSNIEREIREITFTE